MRRPNRAFFWGLVTLSLAALMGEPVYTQDSNAVQEVSGTVRDSSGAVLPGVLITIPDQSLATDTDSTGRFVLKRVPAGKVVIRATFPGFAPKEVEEEVVPGQNLRVEIELEVQSRSDTVTIEYSAPKLMTASDSIGAVTVAPAQVAALPSLGEKDIFRSLQLMPGISASNESSSGLYVRGGTPDQNLVMFDGFTIYKVDHFFGIFSAFNANAVESMNILKGGFDAKYGGRLSSVVDLAGKTSNKDEIEMGGGLSLLSYNGYLDGPLGKKGTFLLAARRSYQSPFSKKIRDSYTATQGPQGGPMGSFSSEPSSSFYDLNGRFTYSPGLQDTLSLSFYYGKDNFDNSRKMDMPSFGSNQNRTLNGDITDTSNWGNLGSSVNWRRSWATNFSSEMTLAFSRFFKNSDNSSKMTVTDPNTKTDRTLDTGSTELNRLNDVTFRLSNGLLLRRNFLEFGAETIRNRVQYGYNFNQGAGLLTRAGVGRQEAVYLQDRFQPFAKLEITPGIRAARYNITQQIYLEPRFSFIYHVTDRFRFKGAGGRYNQFTSDLTREDPMSGDQDFWTLADGTTVPVSRANHYIAGASYESANYLFDVEAYRKDLKGLTEFGMFRPGIGPPPTDRNTDEVFDFSRSFFNGSGRAEGVEFLAQKKFGADIGWITYTLGRVRNNFPGLSDKPYPAGHDSTHEVKILNSYQFWRLAISGNWVYATGKPFTEPSGSEKMTMSDGRTFYRPVLGDKNGGRLPDYHRLDLSATYDLYRGETNRAQAGVSVFNAYKHANVWRRQYHFFDGETITTDVNYLGLTVSAFVNFNLDVPSEMRRAGPAWSKTDEKSSSEPKRKIKPGKEFDFYATIVSIDRDRVSVKTDLGTREFVLGRNAMLGEATYEPGAYVHVYYRKQTEGNVVTAIMRRVRDFNEAFPATGSDDVEPLRPLPWRS
jgi:ferric enterobactin receptor